MGSCYGKGGQVAGGLRKDLSDHLRENGYEVIRGATLRRSVTHRDGGGETFVDGGLEAGEREGLGREGVDAEGAQTASELDGDEAGQNHNRRAVLRFVDRADEFERVEMGKAKVENNQIVATFNRHDGSFFGYVPVFYGRRVDMKVPRQAFGRDVSSRLPK